MKVVRNGLGNRIGCLMFCAAVAITLAAASAAQAGTIPQWPSNGVSPGFGAEVDELSKSIVEVNEAIKSFQKRDLDTCLQQLTKAVKAHPELPPAHALLAKLALMSNQIALVRPALETAVAQAPDHPEIYILFGNLALLENRATDAALHFEKAKGWRRRSAGRPTSGVGSIDSVIRAMRCWPRAAATGRPHGQRWRRGWRWNRPMRGRGSGWARPCSALTSRTRLTRSCRRPPRRTAHSSPRRS